MSAFLGVKRTCVGVRQRPLLTPSEHSALAPYFSVFLSLASVEQGLSFEQASPITPID
jgi:hypothetical protein